LGLSCRTCRNIGERDILVSTLLLIDKDADVRERLAAEIERDGRYRTLGLGDVSELASSNLDGGFDLAGVSLAVIAIDGAPDIVEWARLGGVPVLALVPMGAPTVEQAVATVSKPLKLATLLEAIERALDAPAPIRIGAGWLDARSKRLSDRDGPPNGWMIRLTEKEVAVLQCLHRAHQAVVSKEQLLQEVWGYSQSVTTHTIETHIYRLRRKIETRPELAGLLITEPGGYRLRQGLT
jgi:DNA-binding response OmpR family regulator